MANKIQIRRDTAVNWTTADPTLSQGEIGLDLTNGNIKIGNGVDSWVELEYAIPSIVGLASETYVDNAISNLKDGAGSALDTLNELADALGNDANFATTVSTQLGLKANSADLASVATSGSYNDLTNKPTLFDGAYNSLTGKPTLFDGAYNSLTGKPTLFNGDYNSLSNKPTLFTGDYDDLTDKPTLFSGDYDDLTHKPTLFSGDYDDLTSKPTLFSGDYDDLTNKPTLFNGQYSSLSGRPDLANVATTGNYDDLTGNPDVDKITLGDGNATNPSLVFGTDGGVDTGLFHPADGVVCVSSNGQERLRVDGGGVRVEGFMKVAQVNGNLPNPPEAGMIVLDGTTFKGYNGFSWVDLN
jgi:hypothetical protein